MGEVENFLIILRSTSSLSLSEQINIAPGDARFSLDNENCNLKSEK